MQNQSKKTWNKMQVKKVGHVREVLQGGGGKLSLVGGDPGEIRKERGSGR